MGSVKRQASIIKYRDKHDPKTKYIEVPKIISDDFAFQLQFGYVYPYKPYEESSGVKSYYVKGIDNQ